MNHKSKESMDAEIEPVVRFLQKKGYVTITSCQGGEGHPFNKPTIGIDFGHEDFFEFRQKLIEILEQNFSAFSIILKEHFGRKLPGKKRIHWEFVYVEFFKDEIQRNYITKKQYDSTLQKV